MWKKKICLLAIILIISFSCDKNNVVSGNFSLLVTGNVQGELYPKKMRRGSLGGLARRSTYINKVKKDLNPIILDVGNLFAENTNAIALINSYNKIGYDAFNVGTDDLSIKDGIKKMEKLADFPFISANIIDKESGKLAFKPYMIIKRNGFKIGIVGLSNNRNLNTDYTITNPVSVGQKILKTLAKKTRYQVVMFNGSFDQSMQLKKGLVEADLIFVSGHKEIPRKTRIHGGGAFTYSVGEYGQSIVSTKINIGHVDSSLKDISMLLEREKFIDETLDLLHGGATISLEKMYSGNYDMTQRIKRIKLELQSTKEELERAVNSVEFDFIPLSDFIKEDEKINIIINEANVELN
jgi:2',3'-cyclic-nucleotide 2'-phosphodiesterase (5'-nucleotidase family)